jgi:hypothetical protein
MASLEREVASPLASESGLGAVKDLEHEFARGFPQAELYGARLDDRLRHVIHRVVDEAKASGKSAEEVVAMIREIARRGGFVGDPVRPVSSFPADRLLTKAVTACIERYHEADEPPVVHAGVPRIEPEDLILIANGGDTRGAVGARLRAMLSRENEEEFARAIAGFVRTAPLRGLDFNGVLVGINRILDAIEDGPARAPAEEPPRSRQLMIRGLLFALYEGTGTSNENVSSARQTYLTPADRPITPTR